MIERECRKCMKEFKVKKTQDLAEFFPRNKTSKDGFRGACKECQKNYRNDNRKLINETYNAHYSKSEQFRKKRKVREETRKKYGSAKDKKCNRCPNQAEDWHHLQYKVDKIVAVCKKCHMDIHNEEKEKL